MMRVLKGIQKNDIRPTIKHTINRMLHHTPKDANSSISGLYRKARDTLLVIEASGPLAKTACGLAQVSATAAIVFGTGYGVTRLITLFNPTLERRKRDDELGLIPRDDSAASRRIGLTYFHMACSLLASSVTAFLSFRIFRNKAFLIRLGERPLVVLGVGVVTPFLMASLVHKLPPTSIENGRMIPFGLKEFGHLLYAGTVGLVAAPLYLFGGHSIIRAALITAGTCAGLEGVVKVAPKDAFLNWGRPLVYANFAIMLSFIMTLLLRRDHAAFKLFYRIMMHGGILVHSLHYAHTGQLITHVAKTPSYDPVNASMSLTMDLLNIYGRLAFLLPPYFQLSHEHHFVMQGGRPFDSSGSGSGSVKAGKSDSKTKNKNNNITNPEKET